jgi:hypothetical protein
MDGNMEELSFEEFKNRIRERLDKVAQERDMRAFTLPNILDDPEFTRYLTIEYNFTDRVN